VAAESFAVMREALKGKAGIGTVAIHGRDRLVAIEPRGRGMIMFTLRHEREVRQIDAIDELAETPEKVKPDELTLAKKVIGGFEDKVDFSQYHDTYEDALREMIEAKIKGREIITTEEVEERPKVVNLMDALRKSLDEASRAKKRPAKAPAPAKRRGTKAAAGRKRATA
jgi:DNA end-binding protein Ku